MNEESLHDDEVLIDSHSRVTMNSSFALTKGAVKTSERCVFSVFEFLGGCSDREPEVEILTANIPVSPMIHPVPIKGVPARCSVTRCRGGSARRAKKKFRI